MKTQRGAGREEWECHALPRCSLLPNTCSLSKGGPVTALLPEKTPDFNVYLSQVAELVDAPAGINAPINQ